MTAARPCSRVDRRARADRVIRAALTDAGHHLLAHDIPFRRAYAQAFGSTVTGGPHLDELAAEILGHTAGTGTAG